MRAARSAGVGTSRAALAAALALACGACDVGTRDLAAAPPSPGAAWVMEPARLGVGQVSRLERVVVTPPGSAPHPFAAPAGLEGVWVLDAVPLPVEKLPERWIHRTQVRIRARELGVFSWPAQDVRVVGPGGEESRIDLPPLEIEVASVRAELPDRVSPFGLRAPSAAPASGFWGPALAGAFTALACVGLVALARARQRRARTAQARSPAPDGAAPWERARAELEAVAELLPRDALAAAHALSPALRGYVDARFGGETRGRTNEELAAMAPPFSMRSRWPEFAALVRELDAVRFLPEASARAASEDGMPAWLARARHFVEDSVPPEHRT